MNYAEKIAKGGAGLFIFTLVSVGLGYILKLILARQMSVSDFGLFFSVLAFFGFMWSLKDLGIGTYVARKIPELEARKEEEKIKPLIATTFLFQLAIGLLIGAALFFISDFLAASYFHNPDASLVLKIVLIEFVVASMLMKNILQGMKLLKSYALVEVLRVLIILALLLIFGVSLHIVASVFVASSLLVQIIFFWYIFSKLSGKMMLEKGVISQSLAFGIFIFIAGMINIIVSVADITFLTLFRSLEEVGYYQAALSTSQVLWFFTSAFTVIALPVVSELWSANRKVDASHAFSFLLKLSTVVILPFCLVLAVRPDFVINTLLTQKFATSASALQVLSFVPLLYNIFMISMVSIVSIGRANINTIISAAMAATAVAANILLIPLFGIIGASIASLMVYFAGACISAFYSRRLFGPFIDSKYLRIAICAVIPFAAFSSFVTFTPLYIAISFIVYFILIAVMNVFDPKELKTMKDSRMIPERILNIMGWRHD